MEIEFIPPTEKCQYRLFSEQFEEYPNILFHGTTEKAFASIRKEGFQPIGQLPSTSFATTSGVPLGYACQKRSTSDRGCVIAVKFADMSEKGITAEGDVVYLYNHLIQPEIIGFCLIPNDYQHI